MSDHFEFTQEYVGETFEEVADASAGESPIDLEHPGFASLLTAMRQYRAGAGQRWILEIYAHQLTKHVTDSRARLAAMPIPDAIREPATLAIQAMEQAMDQFAEVLELLNIFLESRDEEFLEASQMKLEIIHQEIPAFIGQLQLYSQVAEPEVVTPSAPEEQADS